MTLHDFFLYSIIDNKFININVIKLFIHFIVILIAILTHKKAKKLLYIPLLKKISNVDIARLFYVGILIILWIIVSSIILLTIVKNSFTLIIFENKYFSINLFKLIISTSILVIGLFIQKFLNIRTRIRKSANSEKIYFSQIFLSFVVWLFVLLLLIKIVLSNFNKFVSYTLFDIKEVSISISDFIYLLIVGIIVTLILSGIKKFFKLQTEKKRIDIGTSTALFKVVKYTIVTLTIVLVLQNVGFKLSILLAGSAALLVGLGLGMQQIFSDVASGFLLLGERTLKINDIIEVDGIVGRVVKSSIRTTTVLTRDNIRIIVPNSKFTVENVINWSHVEKNTRFHVNVGVAYGSDVKLVINILETCANSHNKISKKKKPFVRFNDFGESSLDFQLYFWTNRAFEVENIKSDLRIIIDSKFRENNIQIPFPQRDIHMIKPQ